MSDDILERRKQLLQQRLRQENLQVSAPPTRQGAAQSPLSAAQRRMWFVQRLDPEDTTLNVCVAYRLDGALDSERLRAACATVVARHGVLRTTYHIDEAGEPYQISHADGELSWQEHDLTELAAAATERRTEVLARREFARPFDLSVDAPLRLTLVRTGTTEYVLILVVHHIAWDDESWPVFFAELNAAYRGDALPELQIQYVDVDATRADQEIVADMDYWRTALTPLPERLELPGGHAGRDGSKNADRCVRHLSPELHELITSVAREHAATPFMVLLAAFEALVRRYTTATDFLVSVPVTNRTGRGAAALIGYFGNAVLIRAAGAREETFATLLDATKDACIGGFAHQGAGIDEVIRAISPNRVAGQDAMAQLVQLSFSMRGAANGFELPGVVATELALGSAVAQEELGLMVVLDNADVRIEATYLVDALDEQLVRQFLDHYVQLLETVLRQPDRRLSAVDILGAGRADVLAVSHSELITEQATTVVAMFEAQVVASPDQIALASDDIELSFHALNQRANRLAHWLIGRGVGPEGIVALRMATSVEFVVGILAVLKAGAAYLPIDPAYPADRIDYLLSDAQPALVLDAVELTAAEDAAVAQPDANPVDTERIRPLRPSNIAYVIYTSGSTGRPKGVPVPHDAIAEHLSGFVAQWNITAHDRVLQSTSVSFDASLLDIFVTFVAGARVVIPKPNAYRDIPYVADLVTRQDISVLHMVPSMLATFLLLPEINDWRTLRHVPVGGEALPGEVADRFATVFDAELRNHYGPTEAVVSSTHMTVDGPQGTGIVPIGIPNRNVYLYILDEALQLVPSGVVGEIYLGGRQLARGYLERPSLTAERFVADPFLPGGRLYRTGDLARRDAAGVVEFVGRADEQVKVRGHRIELGEVEAALTDHPAVAHSVVVVAEHASLGQILAAYLVPAQGAEIDIVSVRAHLTRTVPEYMVPMSFTAIDELPLTAHGKLDRQALPAPELVAVRAYREPTTPTEVRLAVIYGKLFDRDRVGADDSFFELGGHSLLAARLIAMIRTEFGVEIDMRIPFDTPTVAGLAARLAERFVEQFGRAIDDAEVLDDTIAGTVDGSTGAEARTSGRPKLVRTGPHDRVPLSCSQRTHWLQRRLKGTIEGQTIPYPIRFDGPLDIEALHAAVEDVVARHAPLRTTFPEHEGTPYQQVHPAGRVPMPVVELGAGADPIALRLERELTADAAYVFDLQTEVQLRLRLLVLDPQTHVLSIVMHHIIGDHHSCQIFVDDLSAAYQARLHGAAPDWPELPIQFSDFAVWQCEVFDRAPGRGAVSDYGQELFDYWRDALAGLPDEIAVAPDFPRPPVLGRSGVGATRVIPAATWQLAKARAEEAGATDFMLCQAICAITLHALGGGDDLAIGAAVANRLDEATDNVIGLFADLAVLRNDLSGDPTPHTVLGRVRDATLDAITRQGVPFERLVETLNPARSLSHNPLFQVMMHFWNRTRPAEFTEDGATTVAMVPVSPMVPLVDIHFDFTVELDGGLTARLLINSDLYRPETAAVFADVLTRVIGAVAIEPDQPVSELDVLPVGWDPTKSVVRLAGTTGSSAGTEVASGPPETDTERTLAAILEELLEITDIDRADGFFALGGDSVIAIQWAARAGEAGLPMEPQLVFEYFTIAELAAAIDAGIANPPAEVAAEQAPADRHHAPMSASGLDDDALRALRDSWSAQG
ncbi:amino acid adenylation domain-containing protein [Nocardia sp. NPDC049149]|uniref:amino acid adenylation domain-containing protein n=1 Tax=Nocardia sp. NPDC049149 TaxID=3364315 RepID=UPI00371D580E